MSEAPDDLVSYLGEGFHTAFRKAAPDSPQAHQIWVLIQKMNPDDWHSILVFVADAMYDAWPDLTKEQATTS